MSKFPLIGKAGIHRWFIERSRRRSLFDVTNFVCILFGSFFFISEPLEYKFATPRDDWFANNTVETSAASSASGVLTVNRRRRNPIRRAVQFLKNKRSNGRSQA